MRVQGVGGAAPSTARAPSTGPATDGARPRSTARQLLLAAATIALGLASRSRSLHLAWFWSKYGGDALWAAMVFFLAGLLFRRLSGAKVAAIALLYSCGTEFSQLYHSAWLDAVRHTLPGRLVLGDTFAWADMLAYGVGVALAFGVDAGFAASSGRESAVKDDG